MSKVVMITGASSGIGYATAELLIEKGWSVYAGARRLERMNPLRDKGADIQHLDVRDQQSVDAFVAHMIEVEGKVDAIFANAGYGVQGFFETVDIEDAKAEFETNVFGVARTLKAVIPHMREQGSGRLVVCSSIVGMVAVPGMPWYPASKHAVEGLCDGLRMEMKEFGIDVVKIQPGYIKTEFAKVAFRYLDKAIASENGELYREQMENFKHNFAQAIENGDDASTIARAVHKALEARSPKRAYRVNMDAISASFLQNVFGDAAIDSVMPKMVFKKH